MLQSFRHIKFDDLLSYAQDNIYLNSPHEMPEFRNQTLHSLGVDSLTRFNELLSDKSVYTLLDYNGWLDQNYANSVVYKLNRHGLRFDVDFKFKDSIMFLGCSHVLGMALPKSKTWTHLVASRAQMNEINIGWPARSLDACARTLIKWLQLYKPRITVLLIPNMSRFEYIDDVGITRKHLSVHSSDKHILSNYHDSCNSTNIPNHLVYLNVLNTYTSNIHLNTMRNISLISQLCQKYNTKLYVYDANTLMRIHDDIFPLDFARDLSHFGVSTQEYITNIVLNDINTQGVNYV